MTIKGVSEVTKGKSDNTELLLQLLELKVSVYFCWIVNNNITVLRRTAKQFGGRTVITNKHGLYITCGASRVRYRMNYCRWKNTFEQLLYKANNWWSLSCDFRLTAYLYNVITAFLVIVPLPPLGGIGLWQIQHIRGWGRAHNRDQSPCDTICKPPCKNHDLKNEPLEFAEILHAPITQNSKNFFPLTFFRKNGPSWFFWHFFVGILCILCIIHEIMSKIECAQIWFILDVNNQHTYAI